eukprot:2225652-Pleurochrysis_carterae.AAC.1
MALATADRSSASRNGGRACASVGVLAAFMAVTSATATPSSPQCHGAKQVSAPVVQAQRLRGGQQVEQGQMEAIDFVFADRATVPGYLGVDCQAELLEHVRSMNADRILLVTEENVDKSHGKYWQPLIDSPDAPPVEKIVLPPGDAAKSWEHLHELVRWNFDVGATKKTVIVAFGGGALLNVAHLYASIAYRGMKLVSVPTTFLAMHDVVTSLKTSICFDGRKNNVGTFYAPQKILIDVGFCRTLPPAELFSGLGELAKNACLFGRDHAEGF